MSTILILDDDANITTFLQACLESDGYRTAVAMDGAEALKLIIIGDVDSEHAL